MKKIQKRYKIVEIEWVDSSFIATANWERLESLPSTEPTTCKSAGYLLHDGKELKRLMGGFTVSGQVSNIYDIPTRAVIKIKTVKK